MNLIEALQKYKKVTNDGGKTVYSTTSGGHVVKCIGELGGVINPTINLLTSTGWGEYKETLKVPSSIYLYQPNHEFLQYVADKQFIQRVNIVLGHLNKDNPDKEILISEYIRDNYKDVIDRIKQYEEKDGI